ncbi:MAG: Uma2 family endonuclease [Gemmataceae bacterium]
MTTAELLALPDDGMERWILRGELWEKPMTKRNRFHSGATARIAQLLGNWLDAQPAPRGEILDGEAGCILSHDPDTTVGIDVVYVSAEVMAKQSADTTLIDGAPILAVEVLSPNDTTEEITSKVKGYLDAGVPLVWVVHPQFRTVTVHRPGEEPELFNVKQELSGEPHLPGLKLRVEAIFSR